MTVIATWILWEATSRQDCKTHLVAFHFCYRYDWHRENSLRVSSAAVDRFRDLSWCIISVQDSEVFAMPRSHVLKILIHRCGKRSTLLRSKITQPFQEYHQFMCCDSTSSSRVRVLERRNSKGTLEFEFEFLKECLE